MDVSVKRVGLQSDIQAAVTVSSGIAGGFSRPIEQDTEVGDAILSVSQVTVEVAVEFAVDFESHLDRTDRADGGTEIPDIGQAGGIAVGHQPVGGNGVGFEDL